MNKLIGFKRIDDEELFTINEDNETFSSEWMKLHFPNHVINKYTAKRLANKANFEPIYE